MRCAPIYPFVVERQEVTRAFLQALATGALMPFCDTTSAAPTNIRASRTTPAGWSLDACPLFLASIQPEVAWSSSLQSARSLRPGERRVRSRSEVAHLQRPFHSSTLLSS